MAEKEVRTQIYLERWQHEALKEKAAEESVSMAHLIREAVTAYLVQREADEEQFDWEAYKNDPIWKIPEIAKELGPSGITLTPICSVLETGCLEPSRLTKR